MESINNSSTEIELDSSFSEQAHLNRPGTGPRYENTDTGCILAILRVPCIIYSLRSADDKSNMVV